MEQWNFRGESNAYFDPIKSLWLVFQTITDFSRDPSYRISFDEQDRSYSGIADLCVEALSDSKPSEVRRDVDEKKLEYSLAGVQEYYILDPSGKHMAFYERTPAGDYQEIQPHRGVIHSNVLPGFQFRLDDLYQRPPLIELSDDPVYSDYVLPEYQAEKTKSARLAEKLRSLGIDPDDI